MSESISLTEAIGRLQEASDQLVDAVTKLLAHNTALDAHADIRELVASLKELDVIYTNKDIRDLIQAGISGHVTESFKTAHSGWDDWVAANTASLTGLASRVTSLEKWRDTGIDDTAKTDLEKALQTVENKYAIILASLQTALMEADANNNQILVDEIKANIQTTLNQKNTELMAVIDAWQQEHTQPTSIS